MKGMSYNERVCCCLPVRIGVLCMSCLIFCIYLVLTVILFHYRQGLASWSTLQQNVDTPLTIEAFNSVFWAFITTFITYTAVSVIGILAIVLQHRKLVRIYHVMNWFFVLLLFTATAAFWTYFKVKQDVYVNDCQDLQNMSTNSTTTTSSVYYTPIQIPGKQIIAGGSDKSECIILVRKLIIGSGICVFVINFLQLYWAHAIGKYATSLKRYYQHARFEEIQNDDDMISTRSD